MFSLIFVNKVKFKEKWSKDGRLIKTLKIYKFFQALRQLCGNVRDGYCPQITFVVCIRNSHSKLFAKDAKDRVGDGQNVPAGTAVTGFGATPDR